LILNLGSLNIDRVFRVSHIARPGETLAVRSLEVFAGGKGANQSVALARAGADVLHVGKIGADGGWLVDKLAREGVDCRLVTVGPGPTGQAMIQVDDAGENSIVLWPGANHQITPDEVDRALDAAGAGDWLLVQNETSAVEHAIRSAHHRGMRVALNPSPFDERVREYPLELVHLLCVNQTEGAALAGRQLPESILAVLTARLPECEILLTLGKAGAMYRGAHMELRENVVQVDALDATAAGDTFLGYFLAGRLRAAEPAECLTIACRAAAVCVSRPGAMDSIPRRDEVIELG
jgi:ribokinase